MKLKGDFPMLKSFEFSLKSVPTIDLQLSGDIVLFESPSATEISVQIEADDQNLEEFNVYQQEDTIYISQQNNQASSRFSFFENVGGNVHIFSNSRTVVINGGRVDIGVSNSNEFLPPKVKIITPRANLEAKLNGISNISCRLRLHNTYLSIQGSVKADIITQSLEIDSSGSSKVKAILEGGRLELDVSGSSQIDVQGTWTEASINLSGSGKISTTGECQGDYKVKASGTGSVVHSGNVRGRIRENTSGCARVRIG
jgi:hypothetical protein